MSKRASPALKNLFLDPNNYRFIDQNDYSFVAEDKLTEVEVQRRTASLILGKNAEEVKDLIASFKKNGWLPVDQIQVRQLSKGRYLVVEGNRRVAALQWLQRRYEESAVDLGKLEPKIFDSVPVILYEEADDAHHMVVMGLGHISGKKRWPAINQARLLKNLIEQQNWTEDDVCDAIGVSRRELRSILKTLNLCDLYKGSDFGDQSNNDKFNLFREVIRSREIGAWLEIKKTEGIPERLERLERLFSWISSEITTIDDEEVTLDPAISTGADVRQLAKIINDENALQTLDDTRRLSEATSLSTVIVKDRIEASLSRLHESLGMLYTYAGRIEASNRSKVHEAADKFRGLIETMESQPRLLGGKTEWRPFNLTRQSHFSNVTVEKFRCLRDLQIKNLRRINIFAGPNNTGKTSILEAIQLLVGQNDIDELIRMVCRRGKISGAPPARWVSDQIPTEMRVSGNFDSIFENTALVIIRNEVSGDDLDDKTFYVSTLEIEASYSGHAQRVETHLFDKKERITRGGVVQVLCPVVFSSPFLQQDSEVLADLLDRNIKAKSKDEVIAFIRDSLDPNFKDVDSTSTYEARSFTRFLVSHDDFDSSIDLTQFGEGVQRIFQIGLLFAYARGGVVLIDEFENAIHHGLLQPLAGLVHRLSERFDVQVFLTTHSRECVEAFASPEVPVECLAAYALRNEDGRVQNYQYLGERLHRMIAEMNIDLRGTSPKP